MALGCFGGSDRYAALICIRFWRPEGEFWHKKLSAMSTMAAEPYSVSQRLFFDCYEWSLFSVLCPSIWAQCWDVKCSSLSKKSLGLFGWKGHKRARLWNSASAIMWQQSTWRNKVLKQSKVNKRSVWGRAYKRVQVILVRSACNLVSARSEDRTGFHISSAEVIKKQSISQPCTDAV